MISAEVNYNLDGHLIKSGFDATVVVDYLLVFSLVAVSGFAYFYVNDEFIAIAALFALAVSLSRKTLEKIDRKFLIILLLFVLWELIQDFYFQSFEFKTLLASMARFVFAYLVIRIVSSRFVPIYINFLLALSIISLVVYICFFSPSLTNFLVSHSIRKPLFYVDMSSYEFIPNYIVIAFNTYQEFRNSGPFWEPGAFAVFLCIALILNIMTKNKIIDYKNIVFIITIITTISTAGFLALFVILALVYLLLKPSLKKVILLLPMIGLFTALIINLPFMLPKIQNNIIIADNNNTSRFGSALSDYKLIAENPIIGYGGNLSNMFGTTQWDSRKMHRNNGITAFITQWGLFIFIFYFYNYYKSAEYICNYYESSRSLAFVFLITIILLGFSQGIFRFPFFHSIMFLQFAYLEKDYSSKE